MVAHRPGRPGGADVPAAGRGWRWRWRGRWFQVAAFMTAMALCWLLWSAPTRIRAGSSAAGPAGFVRDASVKYILLWNSFFDYSNLGMGPGAGAEPFARAGCPQRACHMTSDRALLPRLEDFDAVVFHTYRLQRPQTSILTRFFGLGLPAARSPHQRYIFFLMESPVNCGGTYSDFPHFFNWTMTYRRDSDILAPYGELEPLPGTAVVPWLQPSSAPISPAEARALQRRGGGGSGGGGSGDGGGGKAAKVGGEGGTRVAWLVSHCATQGRREALVARLSSYVVVHVYGDCGRPWPKGEKDSIEFRHMLEHSYHFYLSFENSLCRDYVTEKFFSILPLNVVPVVYGGANYSVVAPPHSYIDAGQFANPRQLADYLNYLVQHPEEYDKFFWWKKHYLARYYPLSSPLCRLCAKLHDDNEPEKSYADMEKWWSGSGMCQDPDPSLTDLDG